MFASPIDVPTVQRLADELTKKSILIDSTCPACYHAGA
jgi:hypothetical protein